MLPLFAITVPHEHNGVRRFLCSKRILYLVLTNAFLWPITTNNGTKQIMTCNRRFARVNAFPFVPNINHQLYLGWYQFYFGRSIKNRWNLYSNSPPMYALALTQSWCFPGVPQFASVVQPRELVELCLCWVVGSLYYRELSVKNRKFWILHWNAILDDLRQLLGTGKRNDGQNRDSQKCKVPMPVPILFVVFRPISTNVPGSPRKLKGQEGNVSILNAAWAAAAKARPSVITHT